MTPEQRAHQIAGDWIMGPIDMGDLERRIADAIRDERKAAASAQALADAYHADFDRELEGGRELRAHLGAREQEPIWTAAARIVAHNNILKDALMRIMATTDVDTIQAIARHAQVKVWGES